MYEIYGVKGLKNVAFRKAFKTEAAMNAWIEAQDGNIEIQGFRFPEGHVASAE